MYIIYNYMPTYLHKKYTKTIPINLYYQKDKQFLAGKKSWNFSLKKLKIHSSFSRSAL